MRRSLAPAAAISAGVCAFALTACTPENAGVGAAGDHDHADRTTSVTSRGVARTPAIPPPRATASSNTPPTVSAVPNPTPTSADPNVISYEGVRGIRIGQTLDQLTKAGRMSPASPGCSRRFAGFDSASPVFDHEKLQFIWANPPLHTPEGIQVGATVAALNRAYPTADRLTPPAGSPTFDGTLVHNPNGVAYLVLHDGDTVQKLIVGREAAVRLLYTQRLDTC